jgi:hypothetical protein
MNLQDFKFPICECLVAVNNGQNDLTYWDNLSTFLTSDYKAIVREDTNESIRLQVTFPDLCLKDNESGIALSFYLHNSFDSSKFITFQDIKIINKI